MLAMREAKLRDWLRIGPGLPHSDHAACRDFMLDPRYCNIKPWNAEVLDPA